MKMRYILLLVAALLLVPASTWASINLEMWVDHRPDAWDEILEAMTVEFAEAHPEVEVTFVRKQPRPDVVNVAVAGGAGPNIVMGAHSWTPAWAANDMLVDLYPYTEADGVRAEMEEDFYPGALATGNLYQGRLYGLPLSLQLEVMYYYEPALSAAGQVLPTEEWTWDDFRAMLPKLWAHNSDGGVDRYGFVGRTAQNPVIMFLLQAGATIWDHETLMSTANTDEYRRAYKFVKDLIDEGRAQFGQIHMDTGKSLNVFLQRQTVFFQDGSYRLGHIYQEMDPETVGVLPLLRESAGKEPASMLTLRNLNIMRSGNPEEDRAAWELLKYIMEPANLARFAHGTKQLVGRRSVLDEQLYAELLESDHCLRAIAFSVVPYSTGIGFTGIPGRSDVFNNAYKPLTFAYLKGEIALEECIAELESKTNLILEPYRSKLN